MKSLSEVLFRLGPANIRSLLGLSLSVVEERNSDWFRNEVSGVRLARRGGGEDYTSNDIEWARKYMALPVKYSYVFKNALVSLERGRCYAGGKWITESFGNPVNAPCEVVFLKLFGWLFKACGKNRKLPDNNGRGYVYCRCDGYFHFVAESLVSLLLSLKLRPEASVVVAKKQFAEVPYYRQYIELLRDAGLVHEIVEVSCDFISAPNVVMTAYESDAGIVCKQSVDLLRDTMLPMKTSNTERKIFLTRKGRRCFDNQTRLEEIAMSHGLEIVDTDGMSVEDQIRLFSEVGVLVANHGAGLTNMIYMPRGGKVLELFSGKWKNDCYFRLSSIMEHKYACIVAKMTSGWGEVAEIDFKEKLQNL